jgi:hypothetical protein
MRMIRAAVLAVLAVFAGTLCAQTTSPVTPEAYEAAKRWVDEHNRVLKAQAAAEKAMEDAHLHKCWDGTVVDVTPDELKNVRPFPCASAEYEFREK